MDHRGNIDLAVALTIERKLVLAQRYLKEVQELAGELDTYEYCAPCDFIFAAFQCQQSIEGVQSLIDIPPREE